MRIKNENYSLINVIQNKIKNTMYKAQILLLALIIFVKCNYEHLKPISKPQTMTKPNIPTPISDSVQTPTPSITNRTISFLALGDSYTIGQSVMQNQSWPSQLQDSLIKVKYDVAKPKVIARTGWTTNDLQTAINSEIITTNYDYVFLLIGVNNQFQRKPFAIYQDEFKILLENAIKFANSNPKHVFVLSIPDYGFTSVGKSNKATIFAELNQYNAENKAQAFSKGVNYINITDISRSSLDNLVAIDGLHPSAYQYTLWVERIMPVLKPYLP